MFGDLPPSSSVMVLSVSAALRMIALPVVVSPVNAILSMPGCSTSAWPTDDPGPVMTFRTPGGKPDLDRDLAERDAPSAASGWRA